MSPIRKKLKSLVNEMYWIDVEEIAKSLGLDLEDDKISFQDLPSMTKNQLEDVMVRVLSWNEYIVTVKSTVISLASEHKQDLIQNESSKTLEVMKQKNNARGSKSEAALEVDSLDEIVSLRKKINNYEVYADYLTSLIKLMDTVHYSSKTLLANMIGKV